jgi:large subunit ribosomal protein L25
MDLTVQIREKADKKARALRKQGFIPAELYGHGVENVHVTVPVRDFAKVFKQAGTNTLITLVIGNDRKAALVQSVQRDFLTNDVSHVDFYQVKMNEVITARIPLEFLGEAPAVKEKGGVLNKAVSEIEVEALPADLPHRLSVDLSVLDDLHKSIYVRDIVVPKNVKVLVESDMAIATVTEMQAEEVAVPVVDVSAVKVEGDEKKAKRQGEKEENEG